MVCSIKLCVVSVADVDLKVNISADVCLVGLNVINKGQTPTNP